MSEAAPPSSVQREDVLQLQSRLPEAINQVKVERGDIYICVQRERLREALRILKEDLGFNYFVECTAVDYSEWSHPRDFDSRFEVIYNLYDTSALRRLFLKVGVSDGQKVPSARPIYAGAEFPEREVWDLFGIEFEGNEQHHRFLLPDDWQGHPLRKEFPLGGDDVIFDQGMTGPAVEDVMVPKAGESFDGKTGGQDVPGATSMDR